MDLGQRSVVELNLHIDDMGDTGAGDFCHIRGRPDTAAQSDSSCDPRDVYPQVSASPVGAAAVAGVKLLGRRDSRLALQRFSEAAFRALPRDVFHSKGCGLVISFLDFGISDMASGNPR